MQQAAIAKTMIKASTPMIQGRTDDCWILIVMFESWSSTGSTCSSILPMTTTSSGVVVASLVVVAVVVVDGSVVVSGV